MIFLLFQAITSFLFNQALCPLSGRVVAKAEEFLLTHIIDFVNPKIIIVSNINEYKTNHDLVFWHCNKFRVSANRLSGKVSRDLFNVKYRLETLFNDVHFNGTEKVAIGFGAVGYQWAARMVVWCADEICHIGECWTTCHPLSPLACEKAPDWIRSFCLQINEFFEKHTVVKKYIRNIGFLDKPNINVEIKRLANFVEDHQFKEPVSKPVRKAM